MTRRRRLTAVVIVLAAASLPLEAQDTASIRPPGHKSETVATVLGVVLPGGGHYYTGENGRATATVLTFVTGLALGLHASTKTETKCEWKDLGIECTEEIRAAYKSQMTAAEVLIFSVGYSIYDAHRSARRVNRRLALREARISVHPYAPAGGTRVHGPAPGLALRLTL